MIGVPGTLFYFFVILSVYYFLPLKFRWGLLFIGSITFYALADVRMLALISISVLISYFTGLKIEGAENDRQRRSFLIICIAFLVAVFILFKYFDFFVHSINAFLKTLGLDSSSKVFHLVMPLGISYYTFKIISYLSDVYQKKIPAETHLGLYALYVIFFPQILCGPIERAEDFLPQLKTGCRYNDELAAKGLERIIIGLFKKLVIADRLSIYVGAVFGDPFAYPSIASFMAAFFYSIQLYCDFSGYSDLAIGMAMMLGIRTKENFYYPYFSRTIKEFWSRWHISLSGWLRDYIYIPLGGNRKGRFRKNLNIMAVFLVSGIWHGNTLNFIIWGMLHGFWNILSAPKTENIPLLRKIFQMFLTFSGVTFTWVFFRAKDLPTALGMIKHAFFDFGISIRQITASLLPFTGDNTCAAYFLITCLLILFLTAFEWRKFHEKAVSYGWIAAMLAMTMLLGKFGNSNFLYGQF